MRRRCFHVVLLSVMLHACSPGPAQDALLQEEAEGSPEATERPESPGPVAVWIDTDPSVLPGGREVDDGLALVQAFHSPELDLRGVSAVFGNADLATTLPSAQEIVDQFGPDGLQVWSGADGADRLGEQTEATRALMNALDQAPLTILALGPVTNVASVLLLRPELRSRITEIVVVAGRRPGDEFRVGSSGDPLRDLNFELDAPAMQVLLDSGVLLTLAPFEISSKVTLTSEHLARLEASGDAGRWLATPVRDWLALWGPKLRGRWLSSVRYARGRLRHVARVVDLQRPAFADRSGRRRCDTGTREALLPRRAGCPDVAHRAVLPRRRPGLRR